MFVSVKATLQSMFGRVKVLIVISTSLSMLVGVASTAHEMFTKISKLFACYSNLTGFAR